MTRKNVFLVLSAVFLLVHEGYAAFRFGNRAVGGVRNENHDRQYRSSYYKAGSSASVAGSQNQGSVHSSETGKSVGDRATGNGGISAWGIVAVIVGIILVGTGGYYAFVFYPYICRKERKYDMIELTNVL